MKRQSNILVVLSFAVGLIALGLNVLSILHYLNHPTTSVAYGTRYYLIYIFAPLTIAGIALLIFTTWTNIKVRWIFIALLIINISAAFAIDNFLQSEANKVLIKLNNLSNQTIQDIQIFARNNQHIKVDKLNRGETQNVLCDCREVVLPNDSGIRLSFQLGDKSFNDYIVGKHSNLFDETLELRIINDSTIYKSKHYGNDTLWENLLRYAPLEHWDKIK